MEIDSRRDYREILRDELTNRCKMNPRYSLRAFARDLELSPSRLSEILSGKQGLSRIAATRVATKLGYSNAECDVFCDLVDSVHARSQAGKDVAREKIERYLTDFDHLKLRNDTFHLIADWYYLPLWELIGIKGFQNQPKWMARRLGITEAEVLVALERLERFGFVARDASGWQRVEERLSAPGGIPSDAIRKFHHEMILKAARSVYMQPMDQRELNTVVLAINSQKLPLARKLIQEFWRDFCTKMDLRDSADSAGAVGAKEKDNVYCLAVQFFGLLEAEDTSATQGEQP